MILSFKKKFPWGKPTNFEEKIINWLKIHTLREDKFGRWNAGRVCQCATGVRTKKYNCFAVRSCVYIQAIQINYYGDNGYPDVIIDGDLLSQERIELLAKNDGFDSVEDFFKWFEEDFQGKIIHWTDLKY